MPENSLLPAGAEILRAFAAVGSNRVFHKGDSLFQEGQEAAGIFLVQQGVVGIVLSGKDTALRSIPPAGPGAVLGLSECVSGRNYRVTAQARDRTQVSYIERQQLMTFLRQHCDICMQIVRLLSEDLHLLYHQFRTFKAPASRRRKNALGSIQ